MKICCIPPASLKTGSLDAYSTLLSKTYSVCRTDTQIIVKPLKGGLDSVSDLEYTYFWFLNKGALVENVIEAEKDGCDAAIISSFSDAGVKRLGQ
jgi:Asp/Glu/hydantoin racemase